MVAPTLGVLALQGDVAEHRVALEAVGATTRAVRRPADLDGLDGVILPGGESTTLSMLLDSSGLWPSLGGRLSEGLPVFGTCAGLVLLAGSVLDGRPDQRSFGLLDVAVRRNGYGRQLDSFETTLAWTGEGAPTLPAVFIRAPVIESTGPGVTVLATLAEGGPVLVRQGSILASTFHPELTSDRRLHQAFVAMVGAPAAPVGEILVR